MGKTIEEVLVVARQRFPEEDFSEVTELVQKCLKQDPKKGPTTIELLRSCSSIIERYTKSENIPAVLPSALTDNWYTTLRTEYTLDIEPAEGQAYTEIEAYEAMEFIGQGAFGVVQTVRRLVDAKVIFSLSSWSSVEKLTDQIFARKTVRVIRRWEEKFRTMLTS